MNVTVETCTDTIQHLLELCPTLYRNDPRSARDYAYRALELARQQEDSVLLARCMHTAGVSLFYCDEYDEALQLLLQADVLLRLDESSVLRARIQHSTGCVYAEMQQNNKALKLFRQCSRVFEQNHLPERVALSLNYMGLVYQRSGKYHQSLSMYLRALRIFKEQQMERHIGTCYNNIGYLHSLMGEADKAVGCYYKALSIYKTTKDLRGEAITLSNLAFKLMDTGQYDVALNYIEKSLSFFSQIGIQDRVAKLIMSKGIIYEKRGEIQVALRYYRKAMTLAKADSNVVLLTEVYFNLGFIYHLLEEREKSIWYFRQILSMTEVADLSLHMDVYEQLSVLYEEVNNSREALACYKYYTTLKEQLLGCQQGKAFGEELMRFRIEDVAKQRNSYRTKSEQLATEIQKKNTDLAITALQLVQKNELLLRLMQKVNRAVHGSTTGKSKTLKDILCELKGHITTPDDRHDFRWHFSLLHQTDISMLTQHFPDLSPAEINICLLLKTGLGTKDMAAILCLSSRTVDFHRHNIRKKLQLPADTNLTQFLMSLS